MTISNPDDIDPEYKDRFKQGMTYGEWSQASYDRYKTKENTSQENH